LILVGFVTEVLNELAARPKRPSSPGASPEDARHAFADSDRRSDPAVPSAAACASSLGRGHKATDSAHLAGFADASHWARPFRPALGCAPHELIGTRAIDEQRTVDTVRHSQFVHDMT
jgi:AraC-like DNA-binding protein